MAESLQIEIKQKGDGKNFPKSGDVLRMHYVRYIYKIIS